MNDSIHNPCEDPDDCNELRYRPNFFPDFLKSTVRSSDKTIILTTPGKVETVYPNQDCTGLSDRVEGGFKIEEMPLTAAFETGKSMLSHLLKPPMLMSDVKNTPSYIFVSGRQTGKSLMTADLHRQYIEKAIGVVKRFSKLQAERKSLKFKKRQHRK